MARSCRPRVVAFEHGLMEQEAKELNVGFVSRVRHAGAAVGVHEAAAATLDGRTALANGKSQWITGPEARQTGHRWRARACATLTGIGTVLADDPRMTVRDVETPRQPLRGGGRQPPGDAARREDPRRRRHADLLRAAGRRAGGRRGGLHRQRRRQGVDLPAMLAELARRGVNELHVEGASG